MRAARLHTSRSSGCDVANLTKTSARSVHQGEREAVLLTSTSAVPTLANNEREPRPPASATQLHCKTGTDAFIVEPRHPRRNDETPRCRGAGGDVRASGRAPESQ